MACLVARCVAGPGSGFGLPGSSSPCCFRTSWRSSRRLVSKPEGSCCWSGSGGGLCLPCRRSLCSFMGVVSTRVGATMTVRDRVPGTVGRRRRRPSAGSRSPTQAPHRLVSATIARRGAPRVLAGRLASGNASRQGCGRYGHGGRGVPSECGPEGPARFPRSSRTREGRPWSLIAKTKASSLGRAGRSAAPNPRTELERRHFPNRSTRQGPVRGCLGSRLRGVRRSNRCRSW